MIIQKHTKLTVELTEEEKKILKKAANILGDINIQGVDNLEVFNKNNIKICSGEHTSNAEIVLRCLSE